MIIRGERQDDKIVDSLCKLLTRLFARQNKLVELFG